jgi:hypothetical protein
MLDKMTPEEVLNSVTEGINAGNLDSLMTLYEPLACFASQPGKLAKTPEGIRESLRSFIDMNGKLDLGGQTNALGGIKNIILSTNN